MNTFFCKRQYLFLFVLLSCCQLGFSQDMDRKLQRVGEIRNSELYFSGIGIGHSLNEADQNAFESLSNSISFSICTKIINGVSSAMDEQEKEKLEEVFQKYSKAGSFANLRNTRQIIIEEGNDKSNNWRVLRYIDTVTLNQVYREREKLVHDYIDFAQKKERNNEIGYALNDYYKALMLLKTSPNMNSMIYTAGDGKKYTALPFLNNKMEELLQDIEVEVTDMDPSGKEVTLCFKYKNSPVAGHILYDYYDELLFENYSNREANNGFSKLKFNDKPAKIDVTISCHDESNVNDEMVKSAMQVLGKQRFKGAKKTVFVTARSHSRTKSTKVTSKIAEFNERQIPENVRRELLAVMKALENAVKTKQYSSVQQYFTTDGYEMWTSLVGRGEASLLMHSDYRFLHLDTTIYCRSMKMQFAFKNNFRPIVEDVCFRFNDNLKISSLSFTVNSSTEREILDDSKKWSDTARMVLISFLEDYKTAYALKRVDYLSKIFSNDALIISGTVIKTKPLKSSDMPNLGTFDDHEVIYSVKSKDEFIADLERNFKRKDWVNIMFEDVDVKRRLSEDSDLFGIQVKQNYFSSNYCDEGYLSLLVDLKGDLPVIYVRVWQEEKSKDFSAETIVNKPGLILQLGNK